MEVVEEEVPVVDDVLKVVAEEQKNVGKNKFYDVKNEYLAQFNPFYYYYSMEQASKANQRQLDALKKKVKLAFQKY